MGSIWCSVERPQLVCEGISAAQGVKCDLFESGYRQVCGSDAGSYTAKALTLSASEKEEPTNSIPGRWGGSWIGERVGAEHAAS